MDPRYHTGVLDGRPSRHKVQGNDFAVPSRRDGKVPAALWRGPSGHQNALYIHDPSLSPDASQHKSLSSISSEGVVLPGSRACSDKQSNISLVKKQNLPNPPQPLSSPHLPHPPPLPAPSKENKLTAHSGAAEKNNHSRQELKVPPAKRSALNRWSTHSLSGAEVDVQCVTDAWARLPGSGDGFEFDVPREGQKQTEGRVRASECQYCLSTSASPGFPFG